MTRPPARPGVTGPAEAPLDAAELGAAVLGGRGGAGGRRVGPVEGNDPDGDGDGDGSRGGDRRPRRDGEAPSHAARATAATGHGARSAAQLSRFRRPRRPGRRQRLLDDRQRWAALGPRRSGRPPGAAAPWPPGTPHTPTGAPAWRRPPRRRSRRSGPGRRDATRPASTRKFLLQEGDEASPTAGDAGAHGARGDPEDLGDLGVVETTQVAQDHGGPEVDGKPEQGGVDVEAGVGPGPTSGRSSGSSTPMVGGVGGAARRSWRSRRRGTSRWRTGCGGRSPQPASHGDHGVLDGVGSVRVVAGEATAHREEPVGVSV